jgi:GNAT superfamily N-acetyltransferase
MNTAEDPAAGTVRQASVGDAPAVALVLARAFAAYEPLYTQEAFAATTPTADRLRARWAEGPVWVGVRADRVVATVAAVARHRDLCVRSMGVLPMARGQGWGARLLGHVEGFAGHLGYRRLVLNTTPFLVPAIRLYRRVGFEPAGDGACDLHGTPLVTIVRDLVG